MCGIFLIFKDYNYKNNQEFIEELIKFYKQYEDIEKIEKTSLDKEGIKTEIINDDIKEEIKIKIKTKKINKTKKGEKINNSIKKNKLDNVDKDDMDLNKQENTDEIIEFNFVEVKKDNIGVDNLSKINIDISDLSKAKQIDIVKVSNSENKPTSNMELIVKDNNNNNTDNKESHEKEASLEFSLKQIFNIIKNRGPDYIKIVECILESKTTSNLLSYINQDSILNNYTENNNEHYKETNEFNLEEYCLKENNIIMVSSVLALRGSQEITKQPLINTITNNILQYNGEIYSFVNKNLLQYTNDNLLKENDGSILFDVLNQYSLQINKELVLLTKSNNDSFNAFICFGSTK